MRQYIGDIGSMSLRVYEKGWGFMMVGWLHNDM